MSAPAGFGKTTLLADWLATSAHDGRTTAWLSLDQRDNDPALFWTYVVTALQTASPEVGADALSLLPTPQVPVDAVLGSQLNDLHAISNEVVLVLDDYHTNRRGRYPGRDDVSAGTPTWTYTPGDRQPRRPDAAAGATRPTSTSPTPNAYPVVWFWSSPGCWPFRTC